MKRLAHLGVELIAWPQQKALRSALARAGVPRLLLVDTDDHPPHPLGLGEDWARVPADETELIAKAENLLVRMAKYATIAPTIGADRVLRRGEASVMLSPSEAKIVGRLLNQTGRVVSRAQLQQLLWPDGVAPGQRSLDYVVQRLRRRIAELNICINTSRGRGFVIYIEDP